MQVLRQGIEVYGFQVRTGGATGFLGSFTHANTATRTYTFQNADGTVAFTNQSFYLGTTSIAINRTTGAMSLTGISIDGSAASLAFAGGGGIAKDSYGNTIFAIVGASGDFSIVNAAGNARPLILNGNNFTFSNNITAASFIKAGGTAAQFLKADGSIDSNTYLASSVFNDVNVTAKLLTNYALGSNIGLAAGDSLLIAFGKVQAQLNARGSGTVTSVSIVNANGFNGSVATQTTTPAITITTTVSGLLKGNGTAISAAVAGTDYLAPNGSAAALTGLASSQVTTALGFTPSNGGTYVINSVSGTTYTTVIGDSNNLINFTSTTAVTCTIPNNATVAYPVGTKIDVLQSGNGRVTFAPGSGVTLNSQNGNLYIPSKGIAVTLIKLATDNWSIIGATDQDAAYINAVTATTYTLALSDASRIVTIANSSPVTITIPDNSTIPFLIGTKIDFIQLNTGKITFSPASGVSLASRNGFRSFIDTYLGVSLVKIDWNIWVLVGSLVS